MEKKNLSPRFSTVCIYFTVITFKNKKQFEIFQRWRSGLWLHPAAWKATRIRLDVDGRDRFHEESRFDSARKRSDLGRHAHCLRDCSRICGKQVQDYFKTILHNFSFIGCWKESSCCGRRLETERSWVRILAIALEKRKVVRWDTPQMYICRIQNSQRVNNLFRC